MNVRVSEIKNIFLPFAGLWKYKKTTKKQQQWLEASYQKNLQSSPCFYFTKREREEGERGEQRGELGTLVSTRSVFYLLKVSSCRSVFLPLSHYCLLWRFQASGSGKCLPTVYIVIDTITLWTELSATCTLFKCDIINVFSQEQRSI